MPLFLCRWPDGDCSIVHARKRIDALEMLDEEGDADGCPLQRISELSIHLSISKDGKLRLLGCGERMEEEVFETAYPVLAAALLKAPRGRDGELTAAGKEQVLRAVQAERMRVSARTVAGPQTESGKRLKASGIDMPGEVIDRLVRDAAKRALDKFRPTAKPH